MSEIRWQGLLTRIKSIPALLTGMTFSFWIFWKRKWKMTIHANNELYLNDAMNNLTNAFEYAIIVCQMKPDWFSRTFLYSLRFARNSNTETRLWFQGNRESRWPWISYPSSIRARSFRLQHFVMAVLLNIGPVGQYQWFSAKHFRDIFERFLNSIISMYPAYREMDITRFNESMNRRYDEFITEMKLHKIRESKKLSQDVLDRLVSICIRYNSMSSVWTISIRHS